MEKIKIKGKRREYVVAEWEDSRAIVKKHLKENKEFYDELAEL